MGKIQKEIKYGYGDITIMPTRFTTVRHRGECNPFVDGKTLPIFTAPMSQIVSCENYDFFKDCGVNPILPRNIDYSVRISKLCEGKWVAFGFDEVQEMVDWFPIDLLDATHIRLCLDLANGHMESVVTLCSDLKKICERYNITCEIMTGNIANPHWVEYMNTMYTSGNTPIDYVRCSIGSGSMCITSTQTKIHYPTASLIEECVEANYNKTLKIIADGGIKGYGDVITAIGLGADYVMIGSLFAQCLESAGQVFTDLDSELVIVRDSSEKDKKHLIQTFNPYRDFYGMASKKAQKEFGGNGRKTAEGKSDVVKVKYTLKGWVDNMVSYFRSAMSYTDARSLEEFKENCVFIVNSQAAVNAVNK